MKTILLPYLMVLLAGVFMQAQAQDRWIAFMPDSQDVRGFKDATGKVRIDTTAGLLTPAYFFENIMAVKETREGKWHSYYLTKAGRKVGVDSLHYYDNTEDCESEGFIRFSARATGLAGMFDKNGDIAIPATYNALSRVNNGLVWAIKGAQKVYLEDDKVSV